MINRKININAVDIIILIIVLLKKKETGLLPYGYCPGGVLVSFFIFTISYKYNFPSDALRINISTRKILYLSTTFS